MRVGIVCGGGYWEEDGTLLPPLKNRMEKARERYYDKNIQKIIVTGAIESRYMAGDAIYHGVLKEDVLVESQSRITRENLMESKIILDKNGWKEGEVISSLLHTPRVQKLTGWILPKKRGYNFTVVSSIDERIRSESEIESDRDLEAMKLAIDAAAIGLGWVYWDPRVRNVYRELEYRLLKAAL